VASGGALAPQPPRATRSQSEPIRTVRQSNKQFSLPHYQVELVLPEPIRTVPQLQTRLFFNTIWLSPDIRACDISAYLDRLNPVLWARNVFPVCSDGANGAHWTIGAKSQSRLNPKISGDEVSFSKDNCPYGLWLAASGAPRLRG